jgi:Transposase
LRQAETGTPVGEVIRKMGISTQAFYRWEKQYGHMGVDEIRRLIIWRALSRLTDIEIGFHIGANLVVN